MKRLHILLAVIGLCALAFPSAPTKVHGQAGIDPNQWYNIIAKHSGKCLDIANGSMAAGTRLMQHTCHFGDNQTFRFIPVGGGYYNIIAGNSDLCIDQANATFNNGGQFMQGFCHSGLNQRFQSLPGQVGIGLYNQIRVQHSGKNMDVANFSFLNGANIMQFDPHSGDNQQFELRPAPAVPCAGRDNDGDGFNACFDCNDNDQTINPGAEPDCEGFGDRNCNGTPDFQECGGCQFCNEPPGGITKAPSLASEMNRKPTEYLVKRLVARKK